MKIERLWLLAWIAAGALACAKGEQGSQTADSTARNLTLAPSESTAVGRDVPASTPAPEAKAPESPKPAPAREAPHPAPSPAPAPLSLAAGTEFGLTVGDTITTRNAKDGDAFSATVGDNVRDPGGRIVIPAGATVAGTIVHANPGPGASGRLELSVSSVTVRDQTYPLAATVVGKDTVTQGRGVTGSEAAKVGGGAAIGALAGKLFGKSGKATVIGGLVGAAGGAVVAEKTKSVDIVLPKGATVRVRLTQALTVKAR